MEAIGIVALLTAVGAVFAFHGLRVLWGTRRFVAASASATGTVTDSVGRWYSDPGDDAGVSRLSHPVVRFVTGDWRTVEFESQVGSNLAPKVGQEVTVLYDPLDPEGARIRSFMMPGVLLLLVLLLLFAL